MILGKKRATTGKKTMMKMRKELLRNLCEHNLEFKSGKIRLPSKYPMMVKKCRDLEEDGGNRRVNR